MTGAEDYTHAITVCCICGATFKGQGYNAGPVSEGRCCGTCDRDIVTPRRFADAARSGPDQEEG